MKLPRLGIPRIVAVLSLIVFVAGSATSTKAKPLSYVGGTMAMQENDETGYSVSIDYTFNPHFALALYSKYEINGDEMYMVGPQLNTLIKRWNLPDGQGNIFNMTGVGLVRQGAHNQTGAWSTMMADYETRRLFVSYEARFLYAGDIEKSVWQRAYAGFAPYLANYNDLNTWFLLRLDHHPAKEDVFVATPVVRFFYKTVWVELGYSSNEHVMLNWTVQF
jgi:hypothetical protein